MTDPIRHLAVLCGDKFKESFPEADYTVLEGEYMDAGETYFPLRITRKHHWLLTIRFFEDRVMILPAIRRMQREVSYNDPKLMDILLSEFKTQIEIFVQSGRITAGEV